MNSEIQIRHVGLTLPQDLLFRIDALALRQSSPEERVTRSAIMRELLQEGLERREGEATNA
jgi:metal-responsive CopG/Arc/MetJ family transcriptional regulator